MSVSRKTLAFKKNMFTVIHLIWRFTLISVALFYILTQDVTVDVTVEMLFKIKIKLQGNSEHY